MKSIYPQYDKNSDMSRGSKNSFSPKRDNSDGDGGLNTKERKIPLQESKNLKQVRRKG